MSRPTGVLAAAAVAGCLLVASCSGGAGTGAVSGPVGEFDSTPPAPDVTDGTHTEGTVAHDPAPGQPADARVDIIAGGLVEPWEEYGWSATVTDTTVDINLGDWGGLIVVGADPARQYAELGLVVSADVPVDDSRFLRVQLSDDFGSSFPMVRPEFDDEDGRLEVVIPMAELIGGMGTFDRILLTAADSYDDPSVIRVEELYLIEGDPRASLEFAISDATASVDCVSPTSPISPYIYGFSRELTDVDSATFEMRPTARRWGGNSTSRYNWELGAWSLAHDYYWQNIDVSGDEPAHETFLRRNGDNGAASAITIPVIGWVAKDLDSYAFPVSVYGDQEDIDPNNPDIGNGVTLDGELIPPPDRSATSVEASPAMMQAWIAAMQEYTSFRGEDEPFMYFLGNEPMLWDVTHRDVYHGLLGYDELLERSLAYGAAIREAAPDALIAGPAVWGWPAYFYSAIDAVDDFDDTPDHDAHDRIPLLEWYLQQMKAYEDETGTRLLDVLDVHFYPQDGSYSDVVDEGTSARRLRATRSLWDPGYRDESWIDERVELIPRMQEWVDENYPGTRLSIGEYSFGAEQHISGALAQAEALGRFGQSGLYAAFYWWDQTLASKRNIPVYWAFRAFRNYDGEGGEFGDLSMPTDADRPVSLFASARSDGREQVLVILNLSPDEQLETEVELIGCDRSDSTAYQYVGNPTGFEPVPTRIRDERLEVTLPPYSITVVELQ